MTRKRKPNLFRKVGNGFEDPADTEARARAVSARAARISQEQRLAEALSRYRCFYFHNNETVGPVTLWRVREMIECDFFDPDVQVILEGTDRWRTYAEFELEIVPPVGGDMQTLRFASRLPCYYFYNDKVCGPMPLLAILHKIRLNELPSDVRVCREGTEVWVPASDVPVTL